MKNNVGKLVKIGILTTFRGQVGKKRKIQKPLFALLLLVAFAPLVFSMTEVIRIMYEQLELFGQGDTIIALGLMASSLIVFIFGIFYTVGSYYMANDIPTYLQLPLKPWEISSSRFVMVAIYEYLTMLIFLLPVIIGYGIAAGKGVLYYLLSLPVFIVVPILPLSLASVLVMAIMSFAKRAMNKDRFTMIASMLGLFIGVGFNIGFQSLIGRVDSETGLQEMIMSGKLSLAQNIARGFPGIQNATKALTENNVFQLLIFLAIGILAFAIFIMVSNALYFRGVLGLSQQVSRRKFNVEKARGFEARNPVITYFIKEMKLIIRTPIYFMNLVLIDILLPVFMLVPMYFSLGAEQINALKEQIMSSIPNGVLVTGAFILFVFISAMNGITATSISREGRQLYMMKFMPVSYTDQMNAKILSGLSVSITGQVIITLVFVFLLELSAVIAFLMLLAGLNAVILTRLTGMFLDSANPKLKWDNEQKAVKQNMNYVFNMLIGMGIAGLAVVFLIFAGRSLVLNGLVFIPGIFVVNMGLYGILRRKFPVMMKRIE